MATNQPKRILEDAVDANQNLNNDLNGDGKVTAADARLAALNQISEPEKAQSGTQQALNLSDVYLQQANDYLDKYKNAQFSYDFNVDPVYQQAKEAYIRQGRQAANNVAAEAASLTGGYGNSYGTMAAQQQYNAALENLNDIIPTLEANAYSRWQDEQSRNYSLAQQYLNMEADQYNRAYNQAQLAAAYKDYTGLNSLGIDTGHYESLEKIDEDWEALQRERTQKEWEQDDIEFAWNVALNAAQFKDYSKLAELGIDVSSQEQQDKIDMAITWAQYGDYTKLAELGVDTSYLEALQQYELENNAVSLAQAYASLAESGGSTGGSYSSGGYSGKYSGGGDDYDYDYDYDYPSLVQNNMYDNPSSANGSFYQTNADKNGVTLYGQGVAGAYGKDVYGEETLVQDKPKSVKYTYNPLTANKYVVKK